LREILMPKLGLTQETGTIIEWKKRAGDSITRGEIIFVVETDKVEQEVEAEDGGVLAEILVGEGEEVPVLTAVARLNDA
jgi:pyruvate dehydrogenase E2 component (dihydrolipoyllysine-residue acetyltransferase)